MPCTKLPEHLADPGLTPRHEGDSLSFNWLGPHPIVGAEFLSVVQATPWWELSWCRLL